MFLILFFVILGYEFAVGGDTPFLINCVYDFENNSAAWDGDFDDLDTCVGRLPFIFDKV